MLKRSINIEVIYTELPFAERFAAAKRDGFDFIEFWDWNNKDLGQVKKLLSENNLKISAMSGDGPYSMCEPQTKAEYLAFIKTSIAAAKEIDCPVLIIHSDALEPEPKQYAKPLNGDYSFTTKIVTMFDVLKTIAPLAEEAGVTFVLEALNVVKDHLGNFLTSTATSADLTRAVGSANIKVLYDAYHMYLNEGKVCETLEKYIDCIGYIHIADAPGRGEPGTGAIYFANVMKCLAKLGYAHTVGFELYPATTSEAAIAAIHACSDHL